MDCNFLERCINVFKKIDRFFSRLCLDLFLPTMQRNRKPHKDVYFFATKIGTALLGLFGFPLRIESKGPVRSVFFRCEKSEIKAAKSDSWKKRLIFDYFSPAYRTETLH